MSGELFALDIETTGLDRFQDRIIGIGCYSPRHHQFFDSVADFDAWNRSHSNPPLFIAHRGSFDVNFLRHSGVDIRSQWVGDTRSLASLLTPRPESLGLEHLAEKFLGQAPYKLDRTKMSDYSRKEVRIYCLKDCELTYQLFEHFRELLGEEAWSFNERWLQPATLFCTNLEYDGVFIDADGLKKFQSETSATRDVLLAELNSTASTAIAHYHEQQVREISETYREMYEKAKVKAKDQAKCLKRYADLEEQAIGRLDPFNWGSPKQLQWLLRDYYCLNIRSDREDKETTNEALLKTLDHPVAKKLVEYREVEKMCSTCIPQILDNIKPDGKVHPTFDVSGTRTGRLSSSRPNFQNIPRGKIRSFIKADQR